MSDLLDNIARVADRWAREARPGGILRSVRFQQEDVFRKRGREHVERLARAVLGKARDLSGMPRPPAGEIRVLKLMTCRLCELRHEACCRENGVKKGSCPLGEEA